MTGYAGYEDKGEDLIAAARILYLQERDAKIRALMAINALRSGMGGSPTALEATLAEISAEVTAEAAERLDRKATPANKCVSTPAKLPSKTKSQGNVGKVAV